MHEELAIIKQGVIFLNCLSLIKTFELMVNKGLGFLRYRIVLLRAIGIFKFAAG